jgi:ribosomal protein S6--L-glutamate ligase
MILSFHPCFDTDIQIILGDRRVDSHILKCIEMADAIILPQALTQNLYEICANSTANMFPNYHARIKYPGKIGQSLMFRDLGLPHPETYSWETVGEFKNAHPDLTALTREIPFLIKEDRRHEAEGVFLIENKKSLKEALDNLTLQERSGLKGFITQAYVPCGGNVLRAVVIGKRIITYWKRPGKSGQEITTISRGAIVDHDWQPDLQEKGKVQALILSDKTGINLAAIDFVFPLTEKDPNPLILEINYYFGRRGLGGTENYYSLLYEAIQDWLEQVGLDPESVSLI